MPEKLAVQAVGHLAKDAPIWPERNSGAQVLVLIEDQDEILRAESNFLIDLFLEECARVFSEKKPGIFRFYGMADAFALVFGIFLEEENRPICALSSDLALEVAEGLFYRDRDHEVIQREAKEESSANKDRCLCAQR